MFAPNIPAIQSLFTVKTRSVKVDLFRMDNGEKYDRDDGALDMRCRHNAGITNFNLTVTRHRLAVVLPMAKDTVVFVWNWENGKECSASSSIPYLK